MSEPAPESPPESPYQGQAEPDKLTSSQSLESPSDAGEAQVGGERVLDEGPQAAEQSFAGVPFGDPPVAVDAPLLEASSLVEDEQPSTIVLSGSLVRALRATQALVRGVGRFFAGLPWGALAGLILVLVLVWQINALRKSLNAAAEKQGREAEQSQGRSRIAQADEDEAIQKLHLRPGGKLPRYRTRHRVGMVAEEAELEKLAKARARIKVGVVPGYEPPAPGSPLGFQLGRPGETRGIRPVEFRDIVGVLSLLDDVKQPLDDKQRDKVAEIARAYFETGKSSINATAKVFLVLNDEQRRDVMRPRTGIDFNLPAVPPGKSPLVEYLATVLEKQAGSMPADPQVSSETTSVCTDRFTVLRGLGYLATQNALTPEQARSGLDFVNELRTVFSKQNELDTRLNKVFTKEQQIALSQKVIPRNEDATAWLVCRYLERK